MYALGLFKSITCSPSFEYCCLMNTPEKSSLPQKATQLSADPVAALNFDFECNRIPYCL